MSSLVRLTTRSKKNGFVYILDYEDLDGKRKRESLGHSNKAKAQKQRMHKEADLRNGMVEPDSMRLQKFLDDSLMRTGGQIRQSTAKDYENTMTEFIDLIGNIDIRKVTLAHGEKYRQCRLDLGNTKATVNKKIRGLKRMFGLAVERKQIDDNPMRYLKKLKVPKKPAQKKIVTFSEDECQGLLRVAKGSTHSVCWCLLIVMALETGMRKSEMLNLVWHNIDFEAQTVEVAPKSDTEFTWRWEIKDTDERILPLSDMLISMLSEHQALQPEGCPYVFVPSKRYAHIQLLREQGGWEYIDSRLSVLLNFTRDFGVLRRQAGIKKDKTFHDLRRTAITNWFRNGMNELDVMTLAGHSSFATTHEYYLAVADNLVDRARGTNKNLVTFLSHSVTSGDIEKGQQA
jgi:integrase